MNRSAPSHPRNFQPDNGTDSSIEIGSGDTSSSSSATDSDSATPSGVFNVGTQASPKADPAPPRSMLCPTPVRRIIQASALVTGGVGLGILIFGGVRITKAGDPSLDANRAENIAMMVGGMLAVWAAFGAFVGGLWESTPPR